jgi:hypothetical protein
MSTLTSDPVTEHKKIALTGFKVPSTGEKCIICNATKRVFSTMIRCDSRNYWGPVCTDKNCNDAIIADSDRIKKNFTILPA